MGTSLKITAWEVRSMSANSRKGATKACHTATAGRDILEESSTSEEVEQEVQ